jgi:hypothetical protein
MSWLRHTVRDPASSPGFDLGYRPSDPQDMLTIFTESCLNLPQGTLMIKSLVTTLIGLFQSLHREGVRTIGATSTTIAIFRNGKPLRPTRFLAHQCLEYVTRSLV